MTTSTIGIDKAIDHVMGLLRDFEKRWGVEPAGILMHSATLKALQVEARRFYGEDGKKPTFRGIKIYTSDDVNVMEIRFVI